MAWLAGSYTYLSSPLTLSLVCRGWGSCKPFDIVPPPDVCVCFAGTWSGLLMYSYWPVAAAHSASSPAHWLTTARPRPITTPSWPPNTTPGAVVYLGHPQTQTPPERFRFFSPPPPPPPPALIWFPLLPAPNWAAEYQFRGAGTQPASSSSHAFSSSPNVSPTRESLPGVTRRPNASPDLDEDPTAV
ncbi:hypothetical protein JDV02_006253 [Purpureocillium takamizusanense]|uniref:Uncharacterized protein n=1 Tax=Purpureocillium takamizusanense TaxID=2060973 RepID=A0A9Q8VB55_9HYPO|nr:uncharacterized protein JDV02_006253 [Purpureocillium takamizusanense]UNI20135.1 hypothetical protein JDV02_006253 [Purpureocillium takamizusanense]